MSYVVQAMIFPFPTDQNARTFRTVSHTVTSIWFVRMPWKWPGKHLAKYSWLQMFARKKQLWNASSVSHSLKTTQDQIFFRVQKFVQVFFFFGIKNLWGCTSSSSYAFMVSTDSALPICSFLYYCLKDMYGILLSVWRGFERCVWNLVLRRTYLITEFHVNFIVGVKHIKLL